MCSNPCCCCCTKPTRPTRRKKRIWCLSPEEVLKIGNDATRANLNVYLTLRDDQTTPFVSDNMYSYVDFFPTRDLIYPQTSDFNPGSPRMSLQSGVYPYKSGNLQSPNRNSIPFESSRSQQTLDFKRLAIMEHSVGPTAAEYCPVHGTHEGYLEDYSRHIEPEGILSRQSLKGRSSYRNSELPLKDISYREGSPPPMKYSPYREASEPPMKYSPYREVSELPLKDPDHEVLCESCTKLVTGRQGSACHCIKPNTKVDHVCHGPKSIMKPSGCYCGVKGTKTADHICHSADTSNKNVCCGGKSNVDKQSNVCQCSGKLIRTRKQNKGCYCAGQACDGGHPGNEVLCHKCAFSS